MFGYRETPSLSSDNNKRRCYRLVGTQSGVCVGLDQGWDRRECRAASSGRRELHSTPPVPPPQAQPQAQPLPSPNDFWKRDTDRTVEYPEVPVTGMVCIIDRFTIDRHSYWPTISNISMLRLRMVHQF
ncbi:uncharacterized protein H6S33_008335 [Morchella sextelata]|uniref:uncharacterized protein n=1 Tax=Morchella sextelata TaxID=1174677 RepID=UPI001D043ACD|nr:uncharacterized protein H6S33_008335 [Morchella sextelata]KAH0602685.1 hypothetical protein H6S33_008335 [Morchella sextelata]